MIRGKQILGFAEQAQDLENYVDEAVAEGLADAVDGLSLGAYNASTNTPTLTATPPSGLKDGAFYIVSVAGTIGFTGGNFPSGQAVNIGDKIYKQGSKWECTLLPQNTSKIASWIAQSYTVGSQVFHSGKIYEANANTINTDIPGVSTKWIPKIIVLEAFQTISNNQFLWGLLLDGDRVPLSVDKDFNIDGAGVSNRLAEGIGSVIIPYIQAGLLTALLPQIKESIGYQTVSNNQFLWGLLFDGDRVPLSVDKDFNIDGAGFSKRLLDYISANISVTSLSDIINRDNPYVIEQWGDSLTAMTGILETIVSLAGSKYTGVNCGVGGETVPTIAARNGGVPCVTTQAFTIPSDTTEIEISSQSNVRLKNAKYNADIKPLMQGAGNSVNPVYVEDIECTLRWTGVNSTDPAGTWVLKRNTAGTARTIRANTIIQFAGALLRRKAYIQIYFVGQNGGYSTDAELVEYIRAMIEFNGTSNYIVVGLHTGTPSSRANLETLCLKEFGIRYVNTRAYISSYQAFEDAGITPTTDDITAIANGTFPPSFWLSTTDQVHFNVLGRTIVGTKIYRRLKQLSILN